MSDLSKPIPMYDGIEILPDPLLAGCKVGLLKGNVLRVCPAFAKLCNGATPDERSLKVLNWDKVSAPIIPMIRWEQDGTD